MYRKAVQSHLLSSHQQKPVTTWSLILRVYGFQRGPRKGTPPSRVVDARTAAVPHPQVACTPSQEWLHNALYHVAMH